MIGMNYDLAQKSQNDEKYTKTQDVTGN